MYKDNMNYINDFIIHADDKNDIKDFIIHTDDMNDINSFIIYTDHRMFQHMISVLKVTRGLFCKFIFRWLRTFSLQLSLRIKFSW